MAEKYSFLDLTPLARLHPLVLDLSQLRLCVTDLMGYAEALTSRDEGCRGSITLYCRHGWGEESSGTEQWSVWLESEGGTAENGWQSTARYW